jgi:carbonic anhydrase
MADALKDQPAKRAAKKSPARKAAEAEDAHKGNLTRSGPPAQPRDVALEELRAQRAENEARAWGHDRTEVHREVETLGNSRSVEVHAVGGRVYLHSHGEAVLDKDGVIDLQRNLAAAFQAVS